MRYWIHTHERLVIVLLVSFSASMLAGAALVLASWYQGIDPTTLTGDAKGYLLLAQNIFTNHVFSFSTQVPFAPESFRTPGYPFFLALLHAFFGNWMNVLFVQAAIVSVAPALLYLLFKPYHERAAFWGSLVFAIEPTRLFLSSSFLSDAVYGCLFLLSLVLLEKGIRESRVFFIALSGLTLGASILVRPIGIFLPLIYIGYLLLCGRFSKQSIVGAIALGATCIAIIFPWMVRNHADFNSWNISSVGNANLMIYNAPTFLLYHPDVRGQAILNTFQQEQSALPRNDALSLSRSNVFTNTFLDIIHGHEASYGVFHLVKTIPFFVTDGLRDIVRLFNVDVGTMPNISTALLRGNIDLVFQYLRSGGLAVALLVLGSGFWIVTTLLYIYAVGDVLWKRLYTFAFILAIFVLYFALLTGPVSNARYRLPVEGMLLVAAAYACVKLKERYTFSI